MTTTLAAHQDAAVIELGRTALTAVQQASTSFVSASLLTDDGFEIVSVAAPRGATAASDGSRFASMASSIQLLSEAVARELVMGDSEYMIIAAARGHMVQMRIAGQNIVLAALFDTDEMLGKALTLSRRCASQLSDALATRPAPASL